MSDNRVAVIDLGTNTFHLLMVELTHSGFNLIYKEKVPVKMGQGGISKNIITPEAQKRAFHTIGHFTHLIKGEGIKDIYVIATSAVRNAENGDIFVREVKKRHGLNVHVVDGYQEAQLIYEGIRFSGILQTSNSLMMDIGGGSVEFIIGNNQEAVWKQSFEIGGLRLMELFPYHDPILPGEVEQLMCYLDMRLGPLVEALGRFNPTQIIGASGTFDTLADMYYASHHKIKDKTRSNFVLPREEFEMTVHKLISLNKADRLNIPGMIAMRVDMIVVAVCLITYVLKYFNVPEMVCSTYALKEGVISLLVNSREAVPIS